jgi:hypothetical protein
MKLANILIATLVMMTPAMAETEEQHCRNLQLETFDELANRTCPDNERRGVSLQGACNKILLIKKHFVPTAKMPDWETYRMMYAELGTEICVHFPDENVK